MYTSKKNYYEIVLEKSDISFNQVMEILGDVMAYDNIQAEQVALILHYKETYSLMRSINTLLIAEISKKLEQTDLKFKVFSIQDKI